MTLPELEQQLMLALLAGDDPLLATLREQYAAATVRDREITSTGFVTYFDIPATAPKLDRKLLHLDDLQIELEGASTPAETAVHVQNGRLRSLSCSVYEGAFPDSPQIRAAWFYGTERHPGITPALLAERDVEELLSEDE